MKIIITESQLNNVIDKFITRRFEPHQEVLRFFHDDSSYWTKNNKIIAQFLKKHKWFFVAPEIWDQIEKMFSLQHDEVQDVIKQWLEKKYNLGEYKPLKKMASF